MSSYNAVCRKQDYREFDAEVFLSFSGTERDHFVKYAHVHKK